jgi:hypothetical protein
MISTRNRVRHPLPASLTLFGLLMTPTLSAGPENIQQMLEDPDSSRCSFTEVYPECHACFIGPRLPGACETPESGSALEDPDSNGCSPTAIYPECHACFIGPRLPGACEAPKSQTSGETIEAPRNDRESEKDQQQAEKKRHKAEKKKQRMELRNCLSAIEFLNEIPAGTTYKVVETLDLVTWRDRIDAFYSLDDKIRELTTKACKLGGDAILVPPGQGVVEVVVFVEAIPADAVDDTLMADVKHAK